MADIRPTPRDMLLKDPLREVTRKERKVLLGLVALSLILTKTRTFPSEMSALGIKIGLLDRADLLLVLAGILAYFLIAFIIYAASDFIGWRTAYYELRDALAHEAAVKQHELEQAGERVRNVVIGFESVPRFYYFERWLRRSISGVSLLRAAWEFGIPVILGVTALVTVILSR